jgi:hypothetical protein
MLIITGWKLIGIGLFAAFMCFVLFLVGCVRIVYWPGCEENRDIPILPQLFWAFGISAVVLLVAGGIMNALRKPELPTDSESSR